MPPARRRSQLMGESSSCGPAGACAPFRGLSSSRPSALARPAMRSTSRWCRRRADHRVQRLRPIFASRPSLLPRPGQVRGLPSRIAVGRLRRRARRGFEHAEQDLIRRPGRRRPRIFSVAAQRSAGGDFRRAAGRRWKCGNAQLFHGQAPPWVPMPEPGVSQTEPVASCNSREIKQRKFGQCGEGVPGGRAVHRNTRRLYRIRVMSPQRPAATGIFAAPGTLPLRAVSALCRRLSLPAAAVIGEEFPHARSRCSPPAISSALLREDLIILNRKAPRQSGNSFTPGDAFVRALQAQVDRGKTADTNALPDVLRARYAVPLWQQRLG